MMLPSWRFGDDEADFATVFHRAAVCGRRRGGEEEEGAAVASSAVALRGGVVFSSSFFLLLLHLLRRDRFQNLLQRLPLHTRSMNIDEDRLSTNKTVGAWTPKILAFISDRHSANNRLLVNFWSKTGMSVLFLNLCFTTHGFPRNVVENTRASAPCERRGSLFCCSSRRRFSSLPSLLSLSLLLLSSTTPAKRAAWLGRLQQHLLFVVVVFVFLVVVSRALSLLVVVFLSSFFIVDVQKIAHISAHPRVIMSAVEP